MAHPPEHSLLRFLRTARQTHLRFLSGALSRAEAPVYVIGNPAADLDSIISALVYSYFANGTSRRHVPLLNLPNIPSGPELRRLRPEFVKALWLSTNPPIEGEEAWDEETAGPLLREHILTVADFATHLKEHSGDSQITADAVLVDWNALPIRSTDGKGQGQLTGLPLVDFTVVGCVDHHVDEQFCPSDIRPALITTAGSCASLVLQALESIGAWPASTPTTREEAQVAQLALGPILIDTLNLTTKDKTTAHDTNARDILLGKLNNTQAQSSISAASSTTADDFYTQILHAKQNSLDLLTVQETLDRDYKEWTETAPSDPSKPLNIGFCSMVKSTSWLVHKSGSPQAFLDEVRTFAEQRDLGIIVIMTAFTAGKSDKFCRELVVCALDEGLATDALKSFVAQAATQLGLEEWTALDAAETEDMGKIRQTLNGDTSTWRRIWLQTDVTKSRKQVAPLVRKAVASL